MTTATEQLLNGKIQEQIQERIGDYVGHSSTFMVDRYRHLLEGHEQEAADVFDAYLAKKNGAHTGAHPSPVARKAASLSGI